MMPSSFDPTGQNYKIAVAMWQRQAIPLIGIYKLKSITQNTMRAISIFLFLFLGFLPTLWSQSSGDQRADVWVNSVFNKMSVEEKIGQLLWIRAYSNKDEKHYKQIETFIKDYHVGGLTFFQGTPEKQVELTNRYQKLAKTPLFISIDAEWGLGMRFKEDGLSFPRQLTLGAIQENRLIYDMGKDIARQMKRVGAQINFAPVADVNNNPNNPVINTRSFGEDILNVSSKSYMYAKGMQDNGIMACAKHFPGHGDTDVDSHYDLPLINHPRHRIDSLELYPFKVLAEQGIESMMVAHLHIPSIDDTPNIPSTLSKKTVTDILKTDLQYDGLIITDGLGMKGVTNNFPSGELEAMALIAGNDVLLLPEDVALAISTIKKYLDDGRLPMATLDAAVKKNLYAKYKHGLNKTPTIFEQNVRRDLESPEAITLKRKLYESAMTVVRNKGNVLPFQNLKDTKFASLALGADKNNLFQKRLSSYTQVSTYQAKKDNASASSLIDKLSKYDQVIISLHDMSSYASKKYGITETEKKIIKGIAAKTKVILVVFGSPYSLKYFDDNDWLVCAYEDDDIARDVAAQALFGAVAMRGKLPITASPKAVYGQGLSTPNLYRLGYDLPERVGLNSYILHHGIDSLAHAAIDMKATPGCAVMVVKDKKVIFEKAYGYHTYSKTKATKMDDIWDLASLTKACAATLGTMDLYEQGKVSLENRMSDYIPSLQNTNKSSITVGEVLSHHSGLQGWLKFYEETITKDGNKTSPNNKFYKSQFSPEFPVHVAKNLYLRKDYPDTIRQRIYDSDMRTSKKYKYSDLGYYLLADMIHQVGGTPINYYMKDRVYDKLGLQTMGYNPSQRFTLARIPPTEKDNYFRSQKVQGYVHDMGAAMWGGVSGHAGLFSNANDVAILFQMLLNNGYYGGVQYFKPETVFEFTRRCDECTRRGMGFDMFELDKEKTQNFSELASRSTFGHLGFTGIATWADPENQIIYIFLSNRTYPSMFNYKLGKEDFRPKIQSVIYEAMIPSEGLVR
jgi:beta-glucosidase-like glycosyl hydrolase/CubicO group peptidase (beta-lactamase class C family)